MANKIDWAFMTEEDLIRGFEAKRQKAEEVSNTPKAEEVQKPQRPQSPIKAFLEQLLSKKP